MLLGDEDALTPPTGMTMGDSEPTMDEPDMADSNVAADVAAATESANRAARVAEQALRRNDCPRKWNFKDVSLSILFAALAAMTLHRSGGRWGELALGGIFALISVAHVVCTHSHLSMTGGSRVLLAVVYTVALAGLGAWTVFKSRNATMNSPNSLMPSLTPSSPNSLLPNSAAVAAATAANSAANRAVAAANTAIMANNAAAAAVSNGLPPTPTIPPIPSPVT